MVGHSGCPGFRKSPQTPVQAMRRFGIGSRGTFFGLWALGALVLCGCTSLRTSGIDPSGEHVFSGSAPQAASPSYQEHPGGRLPWDNTQLIVTPARVVAPVGSNVVLTAGVRGPDAYLRTNERVEWTVEPGGVGHIVDYGRGLWRDLALGDFNWPRKRSPTEAITSTSRLYQRLNLETPTPTDDVLVQRGQAWVSVTSPAEGVSHVTAFAPSVYGWGDRKQSAVILWVDAEFALPAPAINPAGGRHVFTTTVTRHTDHAPCPGWIVRYQITSGPPAAFAQGGSVVEVLTNEAGQASAEIVQSEPAAGVNRIDVEVIRPAGRDGTCSPRLSVRRGSTTATWSAPELSLRKSGPLAVATGGPLTYRIDVTNPGDLPADGVEVTDEIPAGMEYVDSSPPAERTGAKLLWRLGRLEARKTLGLQVRLRTTREGSMTSCAEATATGGLRTRDCITTAVGTPAVEVKVLGPSAVRLGDEATFEILVTNVGQVPATGLLIKDYFDEGLVHAQAQSPIEKDLADLAPGQTHRIGVVFRATRLGELCQEVRITGDAGLQVTGRGCVRVVSADQMPSAPGGAQPGAAPPSVGPPSQPPMIKPAVSVALSGPDMQYVGQPALFRIVVRNTGGATLTNIRVVNTSDPELRPANATPGNRHVGQAVEWIVASLAPGAEELFELECQCVAPADRVCSRVTVVANEGARDSSEVYLSIRGAAGPAPPTAPGAEPPPGLRVEPPAAPGVETPAAGLKMSILALRNPVAVGTPNTYEIQVRNESPTLSAYDVTLVVSVPEEMSPRRVGTTGPARCTIDGQTIRFEPVAQLRPGETPLSYRIHVDTLRPGQGRVKLRAELSSRGSPTPLLVEEETEINAETTP